MINHKIAKVFSTWFIRIFCVTLIFISYYTLSFGGLEGLQNQTGEYELGAALLSFSVIFLGIIIFFGFLLHAKIFSQGKPLFRSIKEEIDLLTKTLLIISLAMIVLIISREILVYFYDKYVGYPPIQEKIEMLLKPQEIRERNISIIRQELERYYADHYKYPDSLEELIPQYIIYPWVTLNPKTNQPFNYRVLEHGQRYQLDD